VEKFVRGFMVSGEEDGVWGPGRGLCPPRKNAHYMQKMLNLVHILCTFVISTT